MVLSQKYFIPLSSVNMDAEVGENIDGNDVESQNVIILTLKERCFLLQQRLKAVEQENIQLTLQCNQSRASNISQGDGKLSDNIAQLNKEKSQLAHHVYMVACENKKLWSRLLDMSKLKCREEQGTDDYLKKRMTKKDLTPIKDGNLAIPHLIRSQTFTTSPNPKLKAKVEESGDNIEASLEEISLKVLNSFLAEKSELVQQYEQMVELQMANDKDFNYKSIGFTYLDDLNSDSLTDIRIQTEKLVEMKKQVFQQQNDLKNFLTHMESIKAEEIAAAVHHNESAVDTFNLSSKSEFLDTSETETMDSSTKWATPAHSTLYQDTEDMTPPSNKTSKISQSNIQHTNKNGVDPDSQLVVKLKDIKANIDRICPLCGEKFKDSIAFEIFAQHVQDHFIGDEEYDSIAENFEMLDSSVGNNFN